MKRPKITWKRFRNSLSLFTTCLGLISFLAAVEYFQSESAVSITLGRPVAVMSLGVFANKAPEATKQILGCVHESIDRTMQSREYMVVVGTTPTLMNPPFVLRGTDFNLVYYLAQSSATGSKTPPSPERLAPSPEENPFAEDNMLSRAVYDAGYGPEESRGFSSIVTTAAFTRPENLRALLKNRYDVELVQQSSSTDNLFLDSDFLPSCIDRIPEKHVRRSAYYALNESRGIWNPIFLENNSRHPATVVTLYIDRPWKGATELLDKSIIAEGGEVLHRSSFYHVVRFPIMIGRSSKQVFLKTRGRALSLSSLRIEYVPMRSPSLKLVGWLLLGAMLLSLWYFFSGADKD